MFSVICNSTLIGHI